MESMPVVHEWSVDTTSSDSFSNCSLRIRAFPRYVLAVLSERLTVLIPSGPQLLFTGARKL